MSNKAVSAVIAILIAVIVLTLIGAGSFYMYRLGKYQTTIANITIANPDLHLIADGTYNGSFDAYLVAATVNVTIVDHAITEIELVRHKTERGQKAEVITDQVVTAQSLQVDTISGATNSSKVILKAIEIALENAA